MKYEEVCWYSDRVGRNMRVKIYGHYGPALIVFPCQDKQSDDFYNNGMIDRLSYYLDNGLIKLYCLDSNDDETVSSNNPDKGYRSYKLEMYHQYVINEVLPFVINKQGGDNNIYLTGLSMGASHALNHFLRRPELFSGCIAISGEYEISRFFDHFVDENIYNNSPVLYLGNMNQDHPYIPIYNSKKVFIEVGDGDYEWLVKDSNIALANICASKGINFSFNFWDKSSVHDWSSWLYSLPYFIDKIL